MNLTDYLDYLVNWLREQLVVTGANGYVLGVSGGLDSAVVAALISRATPNNLGVIMPCHSKEEDTTDALEVINTFKLPYLIRELTSTYDHFANNIFTDEIKSHKLASINTMVRLRMVTLYALAQSKNYLVIGTDNKAEWHTGYFTKHGDGGVDLAPIISLTKREVKEAARILGVPKKIIDRVPSAGLFDGQSDEQELKITYKELDDYLDGYDVSEQAQSRIEYLHRVSNHKRQIAHHPEPFKKEE